MRQRLPIKNEYLIITAIILLLWLSYQLAFRHTLQAFQVNQKLKEKLLESSDLNYQPDYLQRKYKNLSQILNLYKADTSLMRSNIINNIATIAQKENVKLTGVPLQDISFHTEHFILEKLEFEGDFFSLLRLANDLQATTDVGMVRAEIWKKVIVRSHSEEKKTVKLEIYIEIYK